ncbi:unnamed protein product [Camellia sinensis]
MSHASHLFTHSKKLRNAHSLLRHERAILVRWFSNGARPSIGIGDDIMGARKHGYVSGERNGACKSSTRYTSSTDSFHYKAINSAIFKFLTSSAVVCEGNALRKAMKSESPMAGLVFYRGCTQGEVIQLIQCLPPHQEIGMPSLSPTMTEGNIARWLKKEGDKVSPGEVLCEVETDKATVEMECMEEGYLAKIVRGDGEKEIKVGEESYPTVYVLPGENAEVIAITVEDEEDIAKFKDYEPSKSGAGPAAKAASESAPPKEEKVEAPATSPEPKVTKAPAPSSAEDRIFASPLAKKLAEDHNVPLSSIKGTGPDGRIVKADIEDYLASGRKEVSRAAPKGDTVSLDYTDIPHSQIRKITASRLLLSKQTIPHYYLTVDTCVDKLMELRSQLNSLQEASGGKRISINDLVIKKLLLWLFEKFLSAIVHGRMTIFDNNGLFVPVIKDADKKGLSKISDDVKLLAQKAKENSLKPEDYEGGTFTVSNLGGPFGIKQFCAIINPPQAGILAVGSAEKRVVPGSGSEQYDFATFMSVTLSCDHRVIDGAIGAEWLKAFKGYIENPESMLL